MTGNFICDIINPVNAELGINAVRGIAFCLHHIHQKTFCNLFYNNNNNNTDDDANDNCII